MVSDKVGTGTFGRVSAVPRPRRPQPLMRRKRVLMPGVAVVLAMSYLGYVAFSGAAMYYLSVDELQARGASAYGENVRVSGHVLPESVEKDPSTNSLQFVIADKGSTTGTSLPVVYSGVVPDAFKDDANVVLEGKLAASGTFEADNLLVKCPSKYQARTDEGDGSGDGHRPEHHSDGGTD